MLQLRKKIAGAALVVLGTAFLTACDSGESVDVDGSGSDSGSQSQSGGVLTAAIAGEPDNLDPHNTSAYFSFQVLENVYDTLVEPDENLEMQPSIAEEWETSEDQLTWTFTIRQDVKFSDGSDLTAEDVAYSYNRIIDEELSSSYKFAEVKSIKALDPQTLEIALKQPQPNLLAAVGGYKGMAIVSKKNVTSGDVKTNPVGSGPFKLDSFRSGDRIELVRNEEYWGEKPALSGVTFTFVKDPTVALQNLEGGEVQWTDNLPPQQVSTLEESDEVVVESEPTSDYWYLALNQNREPFNDENVRRAIAFAIDREAIVKAAKFGNATVNQTAIPEASSWYHEYAPYSHDPDQAQQLLDDAGVSDLTMDLMVTSDYPETVSAAQVIADQLSEVGIEVEIRELDFSTWLAEQGKGNFDMFMLSWLGNIDPDEFYYAQHHSKGQFNFHGYSNPEVDTLLDEAKVETDTEQRKQMYDDVSELIVDDASYIYLYNPDIAQGWMPEVEGYEVRADRATRFKSVSLSE
ncbi:MAG: Dipeptide-binding ABC transporter, periplasmic substrate-binding component [uncultured Nocardioidaceae bacterium]|uniref:Dipeptide-binding ABC transporter, periplasmic substrate-binding component n=1 Tax=uncultured Nocardioidaceae bacterium TaxID=253824 RepID=A0A6J4LCF5_9ACTN|nr:MAG: Dipeptide-binding ABC transporter, periplasmic substrate-binding component [uncultured Nocardioidaceae bacterium]